MNDSNVFGVSIRAWVTLIVVMTVCVMSSFDREVTEPLYTLATVVVGFYFGRAVGKADAQNNTPTL